jgi:hypothetical protein
VSRECCDASCPVILIAYGRRAYNRWQPTAAGAIVGPPRLKRSVSWTCEPGGAG